MSDPVMLITGASSGIGMATARQAAEAKYRVVLVARRGDKLEQLASELGGPERALAVTCDVTEWEDVEAAFAKANSAFGQVNVVFANAGFGAKKGFLNESVEHWRSMVLTNVYGPALTLRAAIPALTASKGHFIVTGSIAGIVGREGSLYSATKWAIAGFAEAARLELVKDDVRVTMVAPGMVDTPFFDNPINGGLQPEDIARAVMYAVTQPAHVAVNQIVVRPTGQKP